VERFIHQVEEHFKAKYDAEHDYSVRNVLGQYLEQKIPHYGFQKLFARVVQVWKGSAAKPLPAVAHVKEYWQDIKDTVYPSAQPRRPQITDSGYAPRSEVETFTKELNKVLNPEKSEEEREEALEKLKSKY
jgi:hypothetical protein